MKAIKKGQTYSPTGHTEKSDREMEIDAWTIEKTKQQADAEGVDITINHLTVLAFLRAFYVEFGWPKNTHELSHILDKRFEHVGGNKFLHHLFPDGPIAQGTRLAGVPTPSYAMDKSFGSTY